MKAIVMMACLALPATAQDRPDPREQLRAKLDSAFLKKADWVTDYDVARAQARTRKTLIFGYFTTAGY